MSLPWGAGSDARVRFAPGTASRGVLVALCAAVVLAATGTPVHANVEITGEEPIFDGLRHEDFRVRLSDGNVARGNVLRVDLNAEHLELRPTLARNQIVGLETMASLDSRARQDGALAGTNGGYWVDFPAGAPNGLTVEAGRALAGEARLGEDDGDTPEVNNRPRSSVGFQPDGSAIMDLLEVDLALELPSGIQVDIDDLNREPQATADDRFRRRGSMVYDHRYGGTFSAPAGARVIRVERLDPKIGDTASGVVSANHVTEEGGSFSVGEGESTIVAWGERGELLGDVTEGESLSLHVDVRPAATAASAWASVTEAVPGGPLLVRDGQRTDEAGWRLEGFSAGHVTGRQPRTAIGTTGDGQALLVTVDGRRAGHSVGMSLRELADTMRALGARDVLNLDGGGSTTMMIDGAVRNRPSASGRSVANGLFVFSDYSFDHSQRLSGPDRYATAARVAAASHPSGASTVLLSTGESFADALAGGPLATSVSAPLLLTRGDALPDATLGALDELGAQRVVLLGGTGAIDNSVRDRLRSRGLEVERASGRDRYETATEIAGRLDDPDRVFVVSGENYPDALTAAAPAGLLGSPVVLTRQGELPAPARHYLASLSVEEVVVVGGDSAVSPAVRRELEAVTGATVTTLAGADRFATAAALNRWAGNNVGGLDSGRLVAAQGRDFPDALTGGPFAAARDSLLMIVPPVDVSAAAAAQDYLDERAGGVNEVTLLGGVSALSSYQHWQLDQLGRR